MLYHVLGGALRTPQFYEHNHRHLLELGVALSRAPVNSGIFIDNGTPNVAKVCYMTDGPFACPRSNNETQIFRMCYHGTSFDGLIKILRHGTPLPSTRFHSPEWIEARYGVNVSGIATTSRLCHAASSNGNAVRQR